MPADIAIRVRELGKKYTIGGPQEKYHTFRDAIVNSVTAPFRTRSTQGADQANNEFWALRDVSFDVHKGEVIGIIGRNGAGKSTLLKILSRITTPTEGEIEIFGRVGSLLEVGTGFHPELTGRENIFLSGSILGMRKREIEQKFDEIVNFAEIKKFIDIPVKRYSSGMYVRLAFAVAAHLDTEILLVDEVLAVGDAQFQKKSINKMNEVSRGGRTVLFVSHNMGSISNLCEKCILLDGGRLVSYDQTNSVIKRYISSATTKYSEYIQDHVPTKPMNLRRVSLLNNNEIAASEFNFDEGFKIIIEYDINQPIKNCYVWAGLRTFEEIVAFDSADIDVDESLIHERSVGRYKSILKIPPNLLNAGNYYLVVGIAKWAPVIGYDRVKVCDITIFNIGTPEKIRTGRDRPGIIQPFLPWETSKIDNVFKNDSNDKK
jgi:lipopolysaccharide transport system ATP-binding protein